MAQARLSAVETAEMLEHIITAARAKQLDVLGVTQEGNETIILLGPKEPGFWAHASTAPEFHDAAPDPLDRWSKRIISSLADQFHGQAAFPSDGPPYPPFITWALASKRAWVSPVGMLVHDTAGLFASFRGALRVPLTPTLPLQTHAPCQDCAKPCATACPVNALQADHYNVEACMTHIQGKDSKACRSQGCAARRACPISQTYPRQTAQSAFHMRAFLGE